MQELAVKTQALPEKFEDVAAFAVLAQEKLKSVRAEISAIKRLNLAKDVLEQKMREAQELSEIKTRAEMRIGELTAEMPKRQGQRNDLTSFPTGTKLETKEDALAKAGITKKMAAQYEMMAAHPDVVEQAIADARENCDVVSRASVFDAIRTQQREQKKQAVQQRIDEYATVQTGTIDIENPNKKYNIIYADPPWKYWEGGDKNQSLHYTTMTIDDICDLPVKNIADDDCVLFLWVTYPILQDAFRVIEAWGFKYSTAAFVWVKKNKQKDTPFFGNGAWTRANSELCLRATKGNVMRLDAGVSQVVESPIEEHSKKPDCVRELITRLVGELPRVELFCRNPADGWDVWGNEA